MLNRLFSGLSLFVKVSSLQDDQFYPGGGKTWPTHRISILLALPVTVALVAWVSHSPAWGAGFALLQQGTAAMGQGNAFVAEANDPTAIFYNPAGLNQLKRPEVYVGTTFNYPVRKFHSPGGISAETHHRLYENPTIYLVYPFHDRVAAGLGLFAPFGMGTAWHPEWAGRYLTTFSRLKTYNVNPAISVKILQNLSVALGADFLWSSVELKRKVPLFVGQFQLPDGEARLQGDDKGIGFNLGALYEPVAGVKLGVSYRSAISVNFKGKLGLSLPVGVPAIPEIPGTAKLTFPPSVTGGLSVSRFKPFTFNFDVTWTGWSSFDRLDIKLTRPIPLNNVPTTTISQAKNWRDAWAFRFGVNCQVKDNMKLRAGYIYDLTPVPDDTFDPQLPDANRHIFTAGGDLKIWRLTLGIAYNFILAEGHHKNNRIMLNGVPLPAQFQANGRYETNVHSLGLSASLAF